MIRESGDKIQTKLDRTIFIGSIVGLVFLIAISLFRYFYLIPARKDVPANVQKIKKLEYENKALKKENNKLKERLDDEK